MAVIRPGELLGFDLRQLHDELALQRQRDIDRAFRELYEASFLEPHKMNVEVKPPAARPALADLPPSLRAWMTWVATGRQGDAPVPSALETVGWGWSFSETHREIHVCAPGPGYTVHKYTFGEVAAAARPLFQSLPESMRRWMKWILDGKRGPMPRAEYDTAEWVVEHHVDRSVFVVHDKQGRPWEYPKDEVRQALAAHPRPAAKPAERPAIGGDEMPGRIVNWLEWAVRGGSSPGGHALDGWSLWTHAKRDGVDGCQVKQPGVEALWFYTHDEVRAWMDAHRPKAKAAELAKPAERPAFAELPEALRTWMLWRATGEVGACPSLASHRDWGIGHRFGARELTVKKPGCEDTWRYTFDEVTAATRPPLASLPGAMHAWIDWQLKSCRGHLPPTDGMGAWSGFNNLAANAFDVTAPDRRRWRYTHDEARVYLAAHPIVDPVKAAQRPALKDVPKAIRGWMAEAMGRGTGDWTKDPLEGWNGTNTGDRFQVSQPGVDAPWTFTYAEALRELAQLGEGRPPLGWRKMPPRVVEWVEYLARNGETCPSLEGLNGWDVGTIGGFGTDVLVHERVEPNTQQVTWRYPHAEVVAWLDKHRPQAKAAAAPKPPTLAEVPEELREFARWATTGRQGPMPRSAARGWQCFYSSLRDAFTARRPDGTEASFDRTAVAAFLAQHAPPLALADVPAALRPFLRWAAAGAAGIGPSNIADGWAAYYSASKRHVEVYRPGAQHATVFSYDEINKFLAEVEPKPAAAARPALSTLPPAIHARLRWCVGGMEGEAPEIDDGENDWDTYTQPSKNVVRVDFPDGARHEYTFAELEAFLATLPKPAAKQPARLALADVHPGILHWLRWALDAKPNGRAPDVGDTAGWGAARLWGDTFRVYEPGADGRAANYTDDELRAFLAARPTVGALPADVRARLAWCVDPAKRGADMPGITSAGWGTATDTRAGMVTVSQSSGEAIEFTFAEIREYLAGEASRQQQKEKATMANTTTKTTAHPLAATLAADATDAAWRTAGTQFVKAMREPLCGLLTRHLGPDDEALRAKIAEFLKTELGTAMLAGMLSVGLGVVPGAAQQVAGRMSRELRVAGMAGAGDVVADLVMGPLRQVVELYLQDPGGVVAPVRVALEETTSGIRVSDVGAANDEDEAAEERVAARASVGR